MTEVFSSGIFLQKKRGFTSLFYWTVTLKDVDYDFETEFEENLGKFEEIYKNNKNTLEISDILWENIVLEIPIRVVSDEIEPSNTSGDGWELISE